ncbi:MAG TPA: pyridoxamine 5'-phosphate oxidase family protein [Tepidiformaceae bacterium]|nr:pyridoxamine 5'-phosphate oxidase family protein [Tepidiformaceae bacterium]
MPEVFHPGERAVQQRFDSVRLADKVAGVTMHDAFSANDKAFIERMDMFFLATGDAEGNLDCSYKGGDPGFVRVLDETTLAFPIYDGNGMFMSSGNILEHPKVGLLFIDWEHQWRMRVNGVASIDFEDELMAEFPGAQFVVRVQPHAIFPNCPRYIHKMQLVERSVFVPKAACETPEPDWKEHFADVLPEEQQRRRTERQAQREAESTAEVEAVDNPPVGD